MNRTITRVAIPTLVRIKPGALARSGIYLGRFECKNVVVVRSAGLPVEIVKEFGRALEERNIRILSLHEVESNSFEHAVELFRRLNGKPTAIIGLGGGKALDVAKYLAFLAKLPYFSIPTSLSNDGFCSPQASLTIDGKRRSVAAAVPFGVIVDTQVCAQAPSILNLSGVGDLAAKFTAIRDWKLAFHEVGEPIDDFAALLSDGSVHAFMAHPRLDGDGLRLLGTSLMMNGIAMEVCGSSRPASGSEHLISHALDAHSARPRLHGLQVGVATYLMSLVQKENSECIANLFVSTGFWDCIAEDPFSLSEWAVAVRHAPMIKTGYYTFLSTPDACDRAEAFLYNDCLLRRCFID